MSSKPLKATVRRHPQLFYYLLLFASVVAIYVGANAAMLAVGRDCLWHVDGQPLYMSFLAWEGEQLRAAWDALLSGGGLQVPLYTFSLGYGADAPLTMGGFLSDPLNLLSVFFPVEGTIACFTVEIVARMMLAGVTFSLYCFSRGRGRAAALVGSVAYICCGFIMFWGVLRHPKFINWAIVLPLILQGADRLFERKGPVLFIVGMALQFFISIYFAYMSCLVLLAYCLIKYFLAPRKRSPRDFATLVGKFAFALVVAFCLAGLLALPQVISLLSQNRATSGAYVPLLYSLNYYYRVPAELLGGDIQTRGLMFGAYVSIVLVAFALCPKIAERDIRRPWLVALVLCLVGALVPAVGSLFNGRGYATDRWMLAAGFVSAYITCLAVPALPKLDRASWKRVGIGVGVVAALAAGFALAQILSSKGFKSAVWPLAMVAVFVAGYFIVRSLARRRADAAFSCLSGVVLIIGGLTLTCGFYNTPLGDTYGAHFPTYGTVARELTVDSPAAPVAALEDDGVFRHSYPKVYGGMKNSSLVSGTMGIDFYSSLYNQGVDDFRQELGISDHHLNYSFAGSDSRTAIDRLTGAKYYVAQPADEWRKPYGYEDNGTDWGDFKVYRTEDPVALAFSASEVIARERYDALSMVEKSEALLQGVTLADDGAGQFPEADLNLSSESIPYRVSKAKGCAIDGGTVHVSQKNASLTLEFEGLEDAETYLCFTNLDFRGYSPIEQKEALGENPTAKTFVQQALWSEPARFEIAAKAPGRKKAITPATWKAIGYGGKVDWAINMGHSDTALTKLAVTFSKPGEYSFDSMEVVCQPVGPIVAEARALASHNLEDIELHLNGMSATMEAVDEAPQLAVFTVAHSRGWSATVDGEPADVLKADTAFMAVKVEGSGRHVIEFSYMTPGLPAGAWLSLAGLAVLVGLIVYKLACKRAKRGSRP